MRQSEYKYRTLFEALGDGAFLVDQETGRVIDINETATGMIGLARGKILGRNLSDFLDLNKAGAEERRIPECAMICADGTRVPAEVHNTWLTLYGRPLILRLCHRTKKA